MQIEEEFKKDIKVKYRDASVWIKGNLVMQDGTVIDTRVWEEKLERAWKGRRILGRKKKININTATKGEFATLPGINEVLAETIIEYRNTHGYFKSTEEIMKVAGIGGEGTFNKIKEKVAVK